MELDKFNFSYKVKNSGKFDVIGSDKKNFPSGSGK